MLPWKVTFLRLFTPAVPSSLPLSLSASLFLSPSLLSPGLQSCVSQLLGKHFHLDTPDTWNSPFPKLHTSFRLLKVLLSWVPPVHEQESPTIHLLPTLETQSPWLLFLHHSASHQFCLYDDKTASWNQQFLSVPLLTTATMTNPFLSISLTTLTWTSPVHFILLLTTFPCCLTTPRIKTNFWTRLTESFQFSGCCLPDFPSSGSPYKIPKTGQLKQQTSSLSQLKRLESPKSSIR